MGTGTPAAAAAATIERDTTGKSTSKKRGWSLGVALVYGRGEMEWGEAWRCPISATA
jgi:hypothetical protein